MDPTRYIHEDRETKMKTTLFLSTIAVGLLAASTMTFAQSGFGNYPQAIGDGYANAGANSQYTVPADRFTRTDLGYQGNVTRQHHRRPARAPAQDAQ